MGEEELRALGYRGGGGDDTTDHTLSKFAFKHSAVIKEQVSLFTSGIYFLVPPPSVSLSHFVSLSFPFLPFLTPPPPTPSLPVYKGKQPKIPRLCQMMEHHNYLRFIGPLIPAMTDAAPNHKHFHLHFHVAKEQSSHGSPAFQRWARKYLWPDSKVTFNQDL